jgi:hypothetical protein
LHRRCSRCSGRVQKRDLKINPVTKMLEYMSWNQPKEPGVMTAPLLCLAEELTKGYHLEK